jgi:hypothetical protein
MKLYKYTFGEWENYGPAIDDADAFERRIGIDPQFHYVPVTIEEVKLEGYEITVTERNDDTVISALLSKHPDTLDRDQLKNWLTIKGIPFTPQWGEDKLRELALQHV